MTVYSTRLVFGWGSTSFLRDAIPAGANTVFLVASHRATARFALEANFAAQEIVHFTEFGPNPSLASAIGAADACSTVKPDVVVGVGGGSALDIAKCAVALPSSPQSALAAVSGGPQRTHRRSPLVLVPTTAGTGSEVTCFATVYHDLRKLSLDTPNARADIAIVDPSLAATCPDDVAASAAADACCQAVESLLSPHTSRASQRHAMNALVLLRAGIEARRGKLGTSLLAAAATSAGRAIDITRTSLPHAFSYWLTARFGVSHGFACALNLPWFLELVPDSPDYRNKHACSSVQERFTWLATLFGCTPEKLPHVMHRWLIDFGCHASFNEVGIAATNIDDLVAAATASQRAANGPIPVDSARFTDALSRWWGMGSSTAA